MVSSSHVVSTVSSSSCTSPPPAWVPSGTDCSSLHTPQGHKSYQQTCSLMSSNRLKHSLKVMHKSLSNFVIWPLLSYPSAIFLSATKFRCFLQSLFYSKTSNTHPPKFQKLAQNDWDSVKWNFTSVATFVIKLSLYSKFLALTCHCKQIYIKRLLTVWYTGKKTAATWKTQYVLCSWIKIFFVW